MVQTPYHREYTETDLLTNFLWCNSLLWRNTGYTSRVCLRQNSTACNTTVIMVWMFYGMVLWTQNQMWEGHILASLALFPGPTQLSIACSTKWLAPEDHNGEKVMHIKKNDMNAILLCLGGCGTSLSQTSLSFFKEQACLVDLRHGSLWKCLPAPKKDIGHHIITSSFITRKTLWVCCYQ